MKIEQKSVTVGDVCEGYANDAEEGVVGYGGRLASARSINASSSTRTRNGTRSSAP